MRKVLPLAAMERLLKRVGAERVSDDAKVALRDVLEDKADNIGLKAVKLAHHSKRKTVKSEDIKLALE